MTGSQGLFPLSSQKPYIQFLTSLIIILIISVFVLLISMLSVRLIFGVAINEIDINDPGLEAGNIAILKYVQSLQHMSIFLIPSLLISYLMTQNIAEYTGLNKNPGLFMIIITALLVVFLIPVTSYLGFLNSKMLLPEGMSGLELWMQQKEDQAMNLTSLLIRADSVGVLIINLIVLALIPSIGEELLFRGVFQQIFFKWFRSGHLAVWITAIIFSAIHLQFFGFLPRLVLGVVFGYLFLWTKNIWFPVIAHFINNAVPVIVAYFSGWEEINANVDEYSLKIGAYTIIPLMIVISLMMYIMDYSKREK